MIKPLITSTVFACDTSEDDRYVRCDFRHCRLHGGKGGRVRLLNTPQNVKLLDKHVGEEIQTYMSGLEVEFPLLQPPVLGNWNRSTSGFVEITPDVSKILMLFELDEPRSSLGQWLEKFVMATCRSSKDCSIAIFTRSFRCRRQLLNLIMEESSKLSQHNRQFKVLVMLSCHSSNQGQVFSCTPSSITAQCQFEEFCSLHDFVWTCQESFASHLIGIHLSSCFTLKMDSSHKDWPVDASWISNVLNCTVSGSTNEVYETGSQVADLYISLAELFGGNVTHAGKMLPFKVTIEEITSHAFPDLANEMGLKMLLPERLDDELKNQPTEEQVHVKQLVMSDVFVCFLMIQSDLESCSHADALMTALQLRPDVKCGIQAIVLDLSSESVDSSVDAESSAKRHCYDMHQENLNCTLRKCLTKQLPLELLCADNGSGKKGIQTVFFIVFGSLLAQLADAVIATVSEWNEILRHSRVIDDLPVDLAFHCKAKGFVYGVHFTDLEPLPSNPDVGEISTATSDGFVVSGNTSPVQLQCSHHCGQTAVFPVLLYTLQLVTGENGSKRGPLLATQTAAVGTVVTDSQVASSWSAKEVIMEVQHVMSGLSHDCELRIIGCHQNVKHLSINNDTTVTVGGSLSLPSTETQVFPSSIQSTSSYADSTHENNSSELLKCAKSLGGSTNERRSKDLPLMSNIRDICVRHYLLDLTVDFSRHIIIGSIVLFLTALEDTQSPIRADKLHLDCCDLDILAVEEPVGIDSYYPVFDMNGISNITFDAAAISKLTQHWGSRLDFKVERWHMTVQRDLRRSEFPQCVRITYRTKAGGKSLAWADDADGRPCVFNWGSPVNNRAFFPGQDVPGAMSTWDAVIHLQRGFLPVMSSNFVTQLPNYYSEDPWDHFYFSMPCVLPCSCIGFAAGYFCVSSVQCPSCPIYQISGIPGRADVVCQDLVCRLVTSPLLMERAQHEYGHRLPTFLRAACDMLGPYPYARLDIVILPRSFGCMGLANPNAVFLSPSMLCGDGSMAVRLAHEISHAWFGLLIGPRDWTEEWLTEGFATFCEDIILAKAEQWTLTESVERYSLKAMIRWRTLMSELKNTDENLHLMKQEQKKLMEQVALANGRETVVAKTGTVVHNALRPEKRFMQMPYLKGYFLLYHMASTVGFELFSNVLKLYASRYQGCLVSSEDFFGLFFETFPETRNSQFSPEALSSNWLCSIHVPVDINSFLLGNRLLDKALEHVKLWQAIDKVNVSNLRRRKRGSHGLPKPRETIELLELSDQIVLLLEGLLDLKRISHSTLQQLDRKYQFANLNAEVRHRWCELTVKHRHVKAYKHVKRFLIEDQGMGVYLYGELMCTRDEKAIALAREVFELLCNEMDYETQLVVREMVYG